MLAALTVAAIAVYFKENYGVVAFSTEVETVKSVTERTHYEVLLDRVFDLPIEGLTNISGALSSGLAQLADFTKTFGLLLTDGGWTSGENPLVVASKFGKLNVIAFPPANPDKVRLIADAGHGTLEFVDDEDDITGAIVRSLQSHCRGLDIRCHHDGILDRTVMFGGGGAVVRMQVQLTEAQVAAVRRVGREAGCLAGRGDSSRARCVPCETAHDRPRRASRARPNGDRSVSRRPLRRLVETRLLLGGVGLMTGSTMSEDAADSST